MINRIQGYISTLQNTLDFLPVGLIGDVIQILHEARISQRAVFIMGNGGSASTASHFVADLSKNTRHSTCPNFRVIGLTDNMAVMTAYANDEGYENVFSQQLASFVQPDDVVIGISASGKSPNVLRAIELANRVGARTIGFTGFDGGTLSKIASIDLHIDSNIIEHVEDAHLILEHMICKVLREIVQSPEIDFGLSAGAANPLQANSATRPAQLRSSLQVLYDLKQLFETSAGIQVPLTQILKVSEQSLGAASGSLLLLDEQAAVLEAAVAYGGQFEALNTQQVSDIVEKGLAGWVVANQQPVLVDSTREDPRWLPRDWETGAISRSALSVPLINQTRVFGVLTLVQPDAGRFTQEHLAMLVMIGVFLSLNEEKLARLKWGQEAG